MDTGASEHMCNNKKLFETLKEEQAAGKIKIGDGTVLDVKGKGIVKLCLEWIRIHKNIYQMCCTYQN